MSEWHAFCDSKALHPVLQRQRPAYKAKTIIASALEVVAKLPPVPVEKLLLADDDPLVLKETLSRHTLGISPETWSNTTHLTTHERKACLSAESLQSILVLVCLSGHWRSNGFLVSVWEG